MDSVTVDNYMLKLIDACGCLKCYEIVTGVSKRANKFIFKKKDKGLQKPASMKDVPDDENNDSFQGLSKASIYVGEGPILYL